VATYDGTLRAYQAGADVVRAGISGGSICSTRQETANGVPQMTAIIEAAKARDAYNKAHQVHQDHYDSGVYLISDGGITKPADLCKALCFADMVIAGNIFAGTIETPSPTVIIDGISYKHYDGSSTMKLNRIEGVKALVPCKGLAQEVFDRMHQGLQSCCSYQNSSNLIELKNKAHFMKVTHAGLKEGAPHDVIIRESK
jgi:IMP dehydrogenase